MEKCEKCMVSNIICERCKEECQEQEQKAKKAMEHLHETWMKEDRERQIRAMEQGDEFNIVVRYSQPHEPTYKITPEQRLQEHWEKEDRERQKRALEEQRGDEP